MLMSQIQQNFEPLLKLEKENYITMHVIVALSISLIL